MPVDPAIVAALGLDPATARFKAHGGSGFSSTFRLTGDRLGTGERVEYFVKTGAGTGAATMFCGEFASLNAIADAAADFCPRAHAHGALESRPGQHFLATDFIELGGGRGSSAASGRSLAAKLAALHSRDMTGATPVPGKPFGFPVTTCCGSTEQDNSWKATWAEFYAENRLRHIYAACCRSSGTDRELGAAVERTASSVVPRLLGEHHLQHSRERGGGPVRPAVVHGDLWSGNHGRGRIANGGPEELVYDPSSVYGHAEYEMGIMHMFGGFSPAFYREYHALLPKDEPADEWEDRVALYELYHHLNHYAMFGGGYRSGAMSIMNRLIKKYG